MTDEIEIPEGFTRWDGGKCPVGPHGKVQYIMRNGEQSMSGELAEVLSWSHPAFDAGETCADIIAYRIVT